MNALNLAAAAAVEAAWHDIACRSPAGQRSTSASLPHHCRHFRFPEGFARDGYTQASNQCKQAGESSTRYPCIGTTLHHQSKKSRPASVFVSSSSSVLCPAAWLCMADDGVESRSITGIGGMFDFSKPFFETENLFIIFRATP